MGSRTGAGATIYAGVTGASATSTITVANTDLSLNNYRVANVRYRVTANYTSDWSGSFELYDETRQESHTGRQNATLAGATAHVCVFALNSSNIHSGMKVHSLKIWKDGVLYRDLIPAKKNNVLGLYDRVTGGFYSNSGTGTFVAGPVVND